MQHSSVIQTQSPGVIGSQKKAPTAVITHGANPGLVSHFVKQALLNLAAGGAGVIVISQDLDELLELGDRFCALNEGRLSPPRATEGLTLDEIGLMLGGAHGLEVAHVAA